MSTLYIDRKHVRLDLDADALVFYENGERIGTIPLGPLQRIVIRGNAEVDTGLLGRLGQHGIGIIVLAGRKHEPSLFLPRPHKDAARRLAQYQAASDPTICLILAQDVVRQKLSAQTGFLRAKLHARPDARYELTRALRGIEGIVEQIDAQAELAALRGLEGAAANLYFSAFTALVPASLHFQGRNRRPPRDPLNAILSLGYTLLNAEAVLAAHANGLDPAIGFLHQPSHGRDSLASDLVESHRVTVDAWAIHLFNKQILRAEDFSTTTGGCLLGKAGRTRFYKEWEAQAESLRHALDRQCHALVRLIRPEAEVEENAGFDDSVPDPAIIRPAD